MGHTGASGRWRASGLVLDLDGTLLDAQDRLSPRVVDAVRRASAIVPVAIASGREPTDVARYARELGLTTPQISDNGARLLDPSANSTIEAHVIAPEDARQIATGLEDLSMAFFAVDGWDAFGSASYRLIPKSRDAFRNRCSSSISVTLRKGCAGIIGSSHASSTRNRLSASGSSTAIRTRQRASVARSTSRKSFAGVASLQ
ncbi:MAG: HAD hydrolase family protein, partial [Chloroflexi bacterium]|nr:HAD hydrolase family protein [Chloroflexota bacterium]